MDYTAIGLVVFGVFVVFLFIKMRRKKSSGTGGGRGDKSPTDKV